MQSSRLRTVLTLRADFYHRCVDYPDLAALLRAGSFPLAAPDLLALLEMITGPAAVAGLTFQAGLVSRILHDTGGDPGALALLAFALAELYEVCQPGTTLTRPPTTALVGCRAPLRDAPTRPMARLRGGARCARRGLQGAGGSRPGTRHPDAQARATGALCWHTGGTATYRPFCRGTAPGLWRPCHERCDGGSGA